MSRKLDKVEADDLFYRLSKYGTIDDEMKEVSSKPPIELDSGHVLTTKATGDAGGETWAQVEKPKLTFDFVDYAHKCPICGTPIRCVYNSYTCKKCGAFLEDENYEITATLGKLSTEEKEEKFNKFKTSFLGLRSPSKALRLFEKFGGKDRELLMYMFAYVQNHVQKIADSFAKEELVKCEP